MSLRFVFLRRGGTYEVWVDVAYVFVRDVCHFVDVNIE